LNFPAFLSFLFFFLSASSFLLFPLHSILSIHSPFIYTISSACRIAPTPAHHQSPPFLSLSLCLSLSSSMECFDETPPFLLSRWFHEMLRWRPIISIYSISAAFAAVVPPKIFVGSRYPYGIFYKTDLTKY
jgi:hypothetical protein